MKPNTLLRLVELNLDIVAPLLTLADRTGTNPNYANYHTAIDENGYFRDEEEYYLCLNQSIRGLILVPVVHCTYLIKCSAASALYYDDNTGRHEYVIFSESARLAGIDQYLDNRMIYGFIFFEESDKNYYIPDLSLKAIEDMIFLSEEQVSLELQPLKKRKIIVASHERSGTHFLMNKIASYTGHSSVPWVDIDEKYSQSIVAVGPSNEFENLAPLYKTHFVPDLIPELNFDVKIIYIYRNAFDCLYSFWKYSHRFDDHAQPTQNLREFIFGPPMGRCTVYSESTYNTYMERWLDHVSRWLAEAYTNENVVCLSYDKLVRQGDSYLLEALRALEVDLLSTREVESDFFFQGGDVSALNDDLESVRAEVENFIRDRDILHIFGDGSIELSATSKRLTCLPKEEHLAERSEVEGIHIRLNMIVRDEAHTIEAALDSARPIIDSFCIVDTGSSDDTVSAIKKWGIVNAVPGEVHQSTWKNFGYNRTEALSFAVVDKTPTHLLFLDADDRIVIDPGFDKATIRRSISYRLDYLLSGGTHYKLPGLVAAGERSGWRWQGALHEFLEPLQHQPAFENLLNVKVLKNVVKGGRSVGLSQREKYLRDAAILEGELTKDPTNSRNAFYLAQSYRDAGDHESAHCWYLRRAGMSGWDQEIYQAMLEAGKCLERLNRVDEALSQYFSAWEFRRHRRCALYHGVRILRTKRNFGLGLHIAELAYSCPSQSEDSLFMDWSIYNWKLDDETSICAYWEGRYEYSLELCDRVLSRNDIPEVARDRVTKNRGFALHKLGGK